jgi:uroporphyrinogen-III synthase
MTKQSLAGVGVLVTRPEQQAETLVDAIEQRGGTAIRFPVLQIVARDPADVAAEAQAMESPDIVIFVSSNAVRYGLQHAGDARIAAVGPTTAAAVEAAGRTVDILAADGFDSEHLLATEALKNVAGKTVRIMRGQDGRELLAISLRERGAHVDYLPVYERSLPNYAADAVDAVVAKWRSGGINVVTAMSVASFENLITLLPEAAQELLGRTPLVTPAERVLKIALNQFPNLPAELAEGPDADQMVRTVVRAMVPKTGTSGP